MPNLESFISANRQSTANFAAAARSVAPARWSQPVAPGKWTPAQIVEHVAISYEVAARALAGDSSMGSAPRFLRPIIRALGFNGVLRKGAFPTKQKGPRVFAPSAAPPVLEGGITRLEQAVATFEAKAREMEHGGTHEFEHTFFGRLAVADYVRFSELHTKHHQQQLASPV
mgnify:FL=1